MFLAAGAAGSLAAGFAALPAAANSDPHRSYAAAELFDLPPGICAFPVHIDFPVNKEYSTVTVQPDGSTVISTTGSLVVTATNDLTGKSVTVNASGPGTLSISPDGSSATAVSRGLTFVFAVNGTTFGFPSNLVVTSGDLAFTFNPSTDSITSLTRMPHLLLDVCGALS